MRGKGASCITTMVPRSALLFTQGNVNPPFEKRVLYFLFDAALSHTPGLKGALRESINPHLHDKHWQIRGRFEMCTCVCAHLPSAYTLMEQIQV